MSIEEGMSHQTEEDEEDFKKEVDLKLGVDFNMQREDRNDGNKCQEETQAEMVKISSSLLSTYEE